MKHVIEEQPWPHTKLRVKILSKNKNKNEVAEN
jgi:hypothetical protein